MCICNTDSRGTCVLFPLLHMHMPAPRGLPVYLCRCPLAFPGLSCASCCMFSASNTLSRGTCVLFPGAYLCTSVAAPLHSLACPVFPVACSPPQTPFVAVLRASL